MEIILHENITAYLQEKNIIPNYLSSGHGVTCEAHGEWLAYVYYSLDPYHPSAPYLRFAVLDDSVKPETIVEMYEKLKTTLPMSDIILEIHRHHNLYEKLITTYDFKEFRRTYETEVEISRMISHFNTGSTEENRLESAFEMTEGLSDLSRQVYASVHDTIPLREMSLAEWRDLITDDIDFESSIVIYDEDEAITAYMLIYEGEDTSKDFGYCYYADSEAKQRLASAFGQTLNKLQENGYEHINLEVDTTDEYAYGFFNEFVKDEAPVLVSYIRRQKKA
ncbi:hypothetical protein [Salinicoccus halitifaciens]|uniref:N-acetyltransferase domain-containing protein n=1 Tax=Salinicoccus halitifaciens TaxID=1073415 RepID=A0ABV2E5X6_9STAP|nr:hypothetical protein [Salinicoccus halitifaciens]MCD2137102.1 hypothetical protein [Salinicoccus halitifaciens]